jgi:predicted nucleic acid-binding protein
MTLVVDASVAVKWFCRENDTDRARELLAIPDPLIAPDFLLIEAASTFWKKVKRSELLMIHAERHLGELPEFFRTIFPARDLMKEALSLAFRMKHSVYDCIYLALARREGVPLVTADDELIASAIKAGLGEHLRRL